MPGMKSSRIALSTGAAWPDLAFDDQPLAPALAAAGLEPVIAIWDDPTVDWAAFDLVVIRSTWDYHLHVDRFLAWAAAVAAVTPLLNPLPLVRWNAHKHYMRDLAAAGIPIVPTAFSGPNDRIDLGALMVRDGWHEVVIKPAVSASAYQTVRGTRAMLADLQIHLDAVDVALLQPYLPAVEGYGERALVFFDGVFSHAARKPPALSTAGPERDLVDIVPASAGELALARTVLDYLGDPLLYTRVDLIALADGSLAVMEVELVEPSLYLPQHPPAAAAFAAAIARRVRA